MTLPPLKVRDRRSQMLPPTVQCQAPHAHHLGTSPTQRRSQRCVLQRTLGTSKAIVRQSTPRCRVPSGLKFREQADTVPNSSYQKHFEILESGIRAWSAIAGFVTLCPKWSALTAKRWSTSDGNKRLFAPGGFWRRLFFGCSRQRNFFGGILILSFCTTSTKRRDTKTRAESSIDQPAVGR